jgi:hypothetical protein
MVMQWQAEAVSKGKPLRLPIMPFLLRNIWMGAMLLFSFVTASTFFITKVWQVSYFEPSGLFPIFCKQALTLSRPSWPSV